MNDPQGVGAGSANPQNLNAGTEYYTGVPNMSAKTPIPAQQGMPMGSQQFGGAPMGMPQMSQPIPQGYGAPGAMSGMGQPAMQPMAQQGMPMGRTGMTGMGQMGQPFGQPMSQPTYGNVSQPIPQPSQSGFLPNGIGMGTPPQGMGAPVQGMGMAQGMGAAPSAAFGNPAQSGALSMPPIGSPAVTGGIGAPIGASSPQVTGGIGAPIGSQPSMPGGMPANVANMDPSMSGRMPAGMGVPMSGNMSGAMQSGMPGGMPANMAGAQAPNMPGGMPANVAGGMPANVPGAMPGADMGMQNGMTMGTPVDIPKSVPGLGALIFGIVALLVGLIPFVIDILGLAVPDVLLNGLNLGSGGILDTVFTVVVEALPVVAIILAVLAVMSAGKALKAYRPNGKATVGRLCGVAGLIVGIIGALVSIALALIFVFGILNPTSFGFENPRFFQAIFGNDTPTSGQSGTYYNARNSNSNTDSDGSNTNGTTSGQPRNQTEQAEQELERLASAELDKLVNQDPSMVSYIADMAATDFEKKTTFTMEECGLSPTMYAQSMLTDFSYTIKDAAADIESGKGIVYANLRVRSVFDLLALVEQKIIAVNESGSRLTQDQLKSEYKRIYEEALAENTSLSDGVESLEYTYENYEWVLNQEEWDASLQYQFGLED